MEDAGTRAGSTACAPHRSQSPAACHAAFVASRGMGMARSAHDEQDDSQERERAVATIAGWITAGEHVVAFTGAGISTDSGIPDFRGPDGVWTRRDAGLPGRPISSVVNFGDPLPALELARAGEHARRCDVMLVLGSSLVVEPAASLVGFAVRRRARVVLINRGETPYDDVVSLRLWAGIGDVLPPAVERVRARSPHRGDA